MRELLIKVLMDMFEMKDTYYYNLTRDKTAFKYGTITIDDFEEISEEQVVDFADFILEELKIIADDIDKQEEILELINLLTRRYNNI